MEIKILSDKRAKSKNHIFPNIIFSIERAMEVLKNGGLKEGDEFDAEIVNKETVYIA